MKFYRKLLFPLVPVYYAVTWLRNVLYDLGVKKSVSFGVPVICVGNLSVGGTGKTPMIEYLIALLKNDFSIATLSRGYKRKTKGFQLADINASAEILGDEPFQFYSKFKNDIQVAVDSNRVNGIETLLSLKKSPEIILLDDAFQHRKVKAGLNILLSTYNAFFVDDFVLPAGNLREPKSGYKRAHIIIVTKCPIDLSEREKNVIIDKINPLDYQTVFFSSIEYSNVVRSFNNDKNLMDFNDFTLVTGIANAQPLVDFLNSKQLKFEHLNFQDHYEFTSSDIDELSRKNQIITTEKDFMRLQNYSVLKEKLFYLPITVNISKSDKFSALIKQFVSSKK
ncbi:MAG: tetraacyldisaccharide 4'-kinase [Flavobacteriaceae bacterium]|nr:tetraacyldisaccharide 4'-kinase [Flavobacteriaceae bacterium]